MPGAHLPPTAEVPPRPRGVLPLDVDAGEVEGHRLYLLSLELWTGWADLRFARVDVAATTRLTRRVPPAEAWSVTNGGDQLQIHDVVGRGDRHFSNGEVRLLPSPAPGSSLEVRVRLVPDADPLAVELTLPGA